MTNRTVQVWGQGYSTTVGAELSLTPCTITATLNGTQVFSGVVPTVEGTDVGRLPTDQQVLFTFEIPMDLEGSVPMTCAITGADIYMEQILANYCEATGNVSTGPTGFDVINRVGDARANVTCTGATYCDPTPPEPRPEGATGTWGYEVEVAPGETATFSYDLIVTAGRE